MERLRFKDENGNAYPEWYNVSLGQICELITANNKPNFDVGKYVIMDMGSVSTDGKILSHKLTDDDSDMLEKGSLVMPKDDIGGGLIICKTAYIPEGNKYVLGDHVYKLTSTECDTKFLSYRINSATTNRSLRKKVTGSAQLGINSKNISNEVISIPQDINEQGKIGGLLSEIDTLIDKQREVINLLKEIKKGYLQQMFPKKGKNIPEIRFNGFTDAWEQRELSELAAFSKGSGYSKGDLIENGSPIILYGRLYTKYETNILDVDTFVVQKSSPVISVGGEVIVPASGETAEDIAIASVVGKPGIILGGDLNVIYPNQRIDSTFLALSITYGTPHIDMAKRAQGKSVVHLHNSDLKKVMLNFPEKEEQMKISQYFMKLDSLITLHQRKLEFLGDLKKGYMQRLFV